MANQKRITKRVVDEAKAETGDVLIRDTDLRGFGLKVTPLGTKSYFLEYRMGGREAAKGRFVIGRHGSPWTPDLARQEATRLLILVKQGVDPKAEKVKRNRLAVDLAFRGYVDTFTDRYLKREQPRSWQQARRLLDRDITPVFKDRALHDIGRGDVSRLLEDMADRAPALARYAHATLRALFRWAVSRGDLERSPMSEMSPPAPAVSRDRVLTDDELAAVWRAADTLGAPFKHIVRLLILTGQRREEVGSMRWEDVDLESATWTIPAETAKNGKAHLVPLGAGALAELVQVRNVLEDKKRTARGLIFSRTGKTPVSGWSKAKARLDEALAKQRLPAWRIHDLRRTLATGLQRLGVRLEVTEAVLNHVSGSRAGIVGVYQRHNYADEKRAALAGWDRHVGQLIALEGTGASVVDLETARGARRRKAQLVAG